MNTKRAGKCINFGNCTKADNKEIIELEITEDFLCPECNSELQAEFQKEKRFRYRKEAYCWWSCFAVDCLRCRLLFYARTK